MNWTGILYYYCHYDLQNATPQRGCEGQLLHPRLKGHTQRWSKKTFLVPVSCSQEFRLRHRLPVYNMSKRAKKPLFARGPNEWPGLSPAPTSKLQLESVIFFEVTTYPLPGRNRIWKSAGAVGAASRLKRRAACRFINAEFEALVMSFCF